MYLKAQIVTAEFAFGLDSGLCYRKLIVTCLWPVTDAFCVSEITQLFSEVFCVVRAVYKFEFGFLQMKHLTNGGKCKEDHEVIEIHVFNCIFIFPLTIVMTRAQISLT
jgi:hypothetical protein